MQYLIPIVAMGALAAAIAAVLAWVSHALALKGEAKVKIANNGSVLTLPLGANLMNALSEAGYALMAQCGGGGTCATCRVKVLSGLESPTAAQLGPLSPKLRQAGWVLSCQTSAMGDLEIELFEPLVQAWPETESLPTAEEAPPEAERVDVELPPAAQALREALPGFDCDACGYPTCDRFAQALASGKAPIEGCPPGGAPVRERLRRIAQEQGVPLSGSGDGTMRKPP